MAKRIRTDVAHTTMGRFTAAHPDIAKVAKLEVTVIDDRAKVGYHMFNGATEAQKEDFSQLFAKRGFIEMNAVDGPEVGDDELFSDSEQIEDEQTGEHGDGTANGAVNEPEPPKEAKRGRGRPRKSMEERTAAAAKAVKEPKPVKVAAEGKLTYAEGFARSVEAKAKALAAGKPAFRPGTKRDIMLKLLVAENGVSLDEAFAAIGWPKNTMKVALVEVAQMAQKTFSEKEGRFYAE